MLPWKSISLLRGFSVNAQALTKKYLHNSFKKQFTFEEITAEQDRPHNSSKDVWFLCLEDFLFLGPISKETKM